MLTDFRDAGKTIGSSLTQTPKEARASLMALAIAVGAISRPPSPDPFTPYSVHGDGVCSCSMRMGGASLIEGMRYSRKVGVPRVPSAS